MNKKSIVNVVAIGDGAVGKTCLLNYFFKDGKVDFSTYEPTIFNEEPFEMKLDGIPHTVKLIDTAGQEEYENIRKSAYHDAHAFLLCFSVDNMDSFENITPFWIDDISYRNVPIILCATKIDLRKSKDDCITEAKGKALSRKISAREYVETSALERINVKQAIRVAVKFAVEQKLEEEEKKKELAKNYKAGDSKDAKNPRDKRKQECRCTIL